MTPTKETLEAGHQLAVDLGVYVIFGVRDKECASWFVTVQFHGETHEWDSPTVATIDGIRRDIIDKERRAAGPHLETLKRLGE